MRKTVFILLSLLCWCIPSLYATGNEGRTVLKIFGGIDLLSSGSASKAILAQETSTSVSLKGGLGGGVQLLIPLNERVSMGGELGFIFTSFEQKTNAYYDNQSTTASHYVGFSPLVALLYYHFSHVYIQGGIGLSIYRSFITYDNVNPNLQSVTNSDVRTGGCTVLGIGFIMPFLDFFGLDFSVKYYSTFVSINGKTSNDALLMPTIGVSFRF
jgi:hypothetical protein